MGGLLKTVGQVGGSVLGGGDGGAPAGKEGKEIVKRLGGSGKVLDLEEQRRKEEEEERKRREETLKRMRELLAKSRREVEKAKKEALAQLAMERAVAERLAGRAVAVGGLTAGALADVLSKQAEILGGKATEVMQAYGLALADLAKAQAEMELDYDLDLERLAILARYAEAQMMSARAQMMAARPPSLFDRLIQFGSTFALFSAVWK